MIDADHVFNLKQHYKEEKIIEEEEEKKQPNIRAIEQKTLLVKEFGNTRSKRMIDALKTSIVTVEFILRSTCLTLDIGKQDF